MGYPIMSKGSDGVLIDKKKLSYSVFCCTNRPQSESESEKRQKADKTLGPCQRAEEAVSDSYQSYLRPLEQSPRTWIRVSMI